MVGDILFFSCVDLSLPLIVLFHIKPREILVEATLSKAGNFWEYDLGHPRMLSNQIRLTIAQ